MAIWTTPATLAVGDPGTSSYLNTYVRDNTTWLHDFLAAVTGAQIDTNQSTVSTTYADLPAVGPAVTVVTGANAIVMLSVLSTTGGGGYSFMGFAVSGASTIAPADDHAATGTATTQQDCSRIVFLTGLTAGTNTFTAKYRSDSGGSRSFANRSIVVIPLP